MVILGVCLAAILTGTGPFGLKRKGWRMVYTGFCFLTGGCLLAGLFVSIGAQGIAMGSMVLGMSILYFFLGYLVHKGN